MDKQPFEQFPDLTVHITRMANTGTTGTGGEWSAFLRELNTICAQQSLTDAVTFAVWAARFYKYEFALDNWVNKVDGSRYLTPELSKLFKYKNE